MGPVAVDIAQKSLIAVPIAPIEALVLVATRILAALATSPVVSARSVPAPARIWLGVFVALVMLPVVGQPVTEGTVRATWATIAGEAVAGALAGFASTLVYSAVQFGAGLLDIQSGFALGSVYDPTLGSAGSVLERFYSAFAALLFLELHGHHLLLAALRELYVVVPLGEFDLSRVQPWAIAVAATGMTRVAIQLVLPMVGAVLLADVALALLARAAPQLQIFTIGVPVKVGIAIAASIVALPLTARTMDGLFQMAASIIPAVMR